MSIIRVITLTILFMLLAALPSQPTRALIPNAETQFSCTAVTEIPQLECEALVSLYEDTDGPNWYLTIDWLVTNTPCSWYGVVCGDGYITMLRLSNGTFSNPFGLKGDIPAEIGNLTNLTSLDLSHNQLSSLPTTIGNLTNLTELILSGNQLSSLPAEIGNLTSLVDLFLGCNQLLPSPTGPNQTELNPYSNLLSSLPAEIGNLTNLTRLSLDCNQLSSLPTEIGNLTNLTHLGLSDNQLNNLPTEIGSLNNLDTLGLGGNQLSSLPNEIWTLNNLVSFDLSDNQLSGLPSEIGNLNNLVSFQLSGNQLSSLPSEIWTLNNLVWFDLSDNQLNSLPAEIGNLTNLIELNLNHNQLNSLPAEIGSLTKLTWFDLGANQLSSMPAEVGNLINLTRLDLDANRLSSLPLEINNLLKVNILDLSYNRLQINDSNLLTFVEEKDSDWFVTQTVAPAFPLMPTGATYTIVLYWIPIAYTDNEGFYEVSYAKTPDGPYTIHGKTADKFSSSYNITGLEDGEYYYIRIRTYTAPHDDQPNELWSEYNSTLRHTYTSNTKVTEPEPTVNLPTPGNRTTNTPTQTPTSTPTMTSMPSNISTSTPTDTPLPTFTPTVTFPPSICADVSEIPKSECESLVALYNNTDGPNWRDNTGWLETLEPCSWHGVTCSKNHVIGLALQRNGLRGNLGSDIGNLTNLRSLNLSSNQLTTLPAEISNLASLTDLSLAYNRITNPDTELLAFIDERSSDDWRMTQTVAPTDLKAIIQSGSQARKPSNGTVLLTWTPIEFQETGGYYEITIVREGSVAVHGTTPDKQASSYTITDLDLEELHHFLVRTYTSAPYNIWSEYNATALESTPTPTYTPTPEATRPSVHVPDDVHEPNNSCETARYIATNGVSQEHQFGSYSDMDWIKFDTTADTVYRIEALSPPSSRADVNVEIYPDCEQESETEWSESFTPNVRLDFKAPTNSTLYLKLSNVDPAIFGPNVFYDISVRPLHHAPEGETDIDPANGAVIILGGRLKQPDSVQANIDNIADAVYQLFRDNRYSDDEIFYMSTDPSRKGYDALATNENLRKAITEWAVDKVGDGQPLTIYMIDHGDTDVLYVDNVDGEVLEPDDLNRWIAALEAQVPDLRSNIIIEACSSGSFIALAKSVSKPGRLVITSANNTNPAYASQEGALFSDRFLTMLREGYNFYHSFWEAEGVAREVNFLQEPWIDANGDGTPDRYSDDYELDGHEAGTDRLNADTWAPYIVRAKGPTTADLANSRIGTIQAEVRDNKEVKRVWAAVYEPDYQPPQNSRELIPENLPIFELEAQGDDIFRGEYNFTKEGEYRVAIYAEDNDRLKARLMILKVPYTEEQPELYGSDAPIKHFLPLIRQ